MVDYSNHIRNYLIRCVFSVYSIQNTSPALGRAFVTKKWKKQFINSKNFSTSPNISLIIK